VTSTFLAAASIMHRLTLLALVACTQTVPQKPTPQTASTSRGMHADQHLDEARDHDRRADELASWPEARRNDVGRFDDPNVGVWYRTWGDQPTDQRRQAEAHRSEAAQLHATYEQACANIAPEQVRVSPLQRFGQGGTPTPNGVIVFLEAGSIAPDRLLAELDCHRAWMMLSEAGMEECPLDLPGLSVQARGDKTGISVELRVKDPALVSELQRRAERELEMAAQRRGTAR